MDEDKKNIRTKNGYKFGLLFTFVYFLIGGAGILILNFLLEQTNLNYSSNINYDSWVFLLMTCFIMYYIAIRFIYRDRQYIQLLLDNRKKLNLYKTIFDKMHEGLIITDPKGKILNVNPSFTETTGYTKEEALDKDPSFLNSGMHSKDFYKNMWRTIKKTGKWQGEIINKRKNGNIYPEYLSITALLNSEGNVSNYIGIFTDISKQRKAEDKVEFLTHYDSLTRLPKHDLFMKHLHNFIEINEQQIGFSLYIIEVRRLRALNATKGYQVGDEIIQKLAIRLQNTFKGITIGRVNSKEFALFFPTIVNKIEVFQKVKELAKEIERPLQYEDEDLFVTSNIGISIFPGHGKTAESIYKHASVAKTLAKDLGRPYQLSGDKLTKEMARKVALEKDLMRALEREELFLVYQPQINIKQETLIGFEALLRWDHPEHGLISPGEFIPIAEEAGVINSIGEWIIETACKQQKQWKDEGYSSLKIAINLSPKQLQDPDLIEKVAALMKKYEVTPSLLEFEITENMNLFETDSFLQKIKELKMLGIELSVDDFGTGHSSLSYLQQLPIDHVKIDRSFIWDIPENRNNIALTKAIIAMAHELGLTVVAEGIETIEQLELLREYECEYAQGFYFSKPMPVEQIDQLLCKSDDYQKALNL